MISPLESPAAMLLNTVPTRSMPWACRSRSALSGAKAPDGAGASAHDASNRCMERNRVTYGPTKVDSGHECPSLYVVGGGALELPTKGQTPVYGWCAST
jgi:hypothetical protein